MRKLFEPLLYLCKAVVFIALVAACLLPKESAMQLRPVISNVSFLLCTALIYQFYRSGALGRRTPLAEALAKAKVDRIAGGLIIASNLVLSFVL